MCLLSQVKMLALEVMKIYPEGHTVSIGQVFRLGERLGFFLNEQNFYTAIKLTFQELQINCTKDLAC